MFLTRLTSVVKLALRVALIGAALVSGPLALAAETKQSTLSASDGNSLTASNFAGIMALYLQPGQIKDAKFLFQECFGGGMLPALQSSLGDSIKWVAGSASTAEQAAWGQKDPTKKPGYWTEPLAKELAKKDQKLGDTLQKASDADVRGPKGNPKRETPQGAGSKDGTDIKMSDGTSHHAIIWTDAKDANRHDNNIAAIKNALNAAWAGSADISITEVSTEKGLTDAMEKLKKDGKLNKDEEFLFYATGHGGRKTTVVPEKARVEAKGVDVETFVLDLETIQAVFNSDPDHTAPQPTLEINYSGLQTFDQVFLNGHLLGMLDPSQTDMFFNVDKSWLSLNNTIEIDNSASDSSFLLDTKVFDTGAVNDSVPEPGILGLLGAGLAALIGLRRRRRWW